MGSVPVTVFGAGSYGLRFVWGTVFAQRAVPGAEIVAFVDPSPDESRFEGTPLEVVRDVGEAGTAARRIPVYPCPEIWKQAHRDQLARMIVDLAVPIAEVPGCLVTCLEAGVRRFILPKPVALDLTAYEAIAALLDRHGARAVVTSNWAFAKAPRAFRALLDAVRREHPLHAARIIYSKWSSKADPLPPMEAEVPHALQLLDVAGLLPRATTSLREVRATPTALNCSWAVDDLTGGVRLESDVRSTSGRIRRLTVWGGSRHTPVRVEGDFDVGFDWSTGEATRHASIRVIVGRGRARAEHEVVALDHTMRCMYRPIVEALSSDEFEALPGALTLRRYGPLSKHVSALAIAWQQQVHRRV